MALTTTQVNAAFVALLGRAAEGNANAWAVNSADTKTLANTILSVDGKYKDSLEQAKTNEDFVEALYKQVLGRNSDADGKAVWLKALASGTSREELMTKFVAAAKAEDPNLTAFYTSNQQFLENVYSALLNRGVDNSGLETWMNLLQNGVSRAEVVAKIIDAINANQASDDYAIYNAKMSVADAVTAAFAGPKAGLNAAENEALNNKLIGIMNSVTSTDVTEEIIKAEITQVVGSYGKEAAPLTFKAVTDNMEKYDLGNADSTTAQTFRGNINLQNADKSTINDKATLNTSKFSDTLIVDVIPSTAGAAFDYNDNAKQVKTFAEQAGIKNLTINNGTASIEKLDNAGISENLKITGAANVAVTVSEALNYLEVNTGGKADATAEIAVNANLKEYVGKGSGKDNITISGAATTTTVDKINTGAGNDTLIVSGNGSATNVDLGAGNDELIVSGGSIANAKINLGANNDVITITSVKDNGLAGATIDGGAGRDTLIVSGDISAKGTFKLSNVEVLHASGADVKVSYAQIKDQALTLTKSGAGTLEINAANETAINLNLNNKVVSGDNTALTELDLTNVGSGANSGVTVTLNKDDGIAETIMLHADAKGAKAVKVTGLADNDVLKGGAIDVNISGPFVLFKPKGEGAALKANAAYWIKTNADVSTAANALAALGKVTLADQQKALVAFNTDNGTYIYSVSGKVGDLEPANFTLAAIVDDKINNKDSIKGGEITFTADDDPIKLDLVTKTFDSLGVDKKLDLTDLDTYKTANAITVTGVSGATLTVSGANAQIETVNAFITANTGKVAKDASVTSTAVNVYLSGNQPLDFSKANGAGVDNDKIASGADKLYLDTTRLITLKDAKPFGENLKLDLVDIVGANIAISGDVSAASGDLTKLFVNADSNDNIALTLASGVDFTNKVATLTNAAETINATKSNITTGNITVTTAFENISSADTLSLKVAQNDAVTLALSDARETISLTKSDDDNKVTISAFNKDNDKLKLSEIHASLTGASVNTTQEATTSAPLAGAVALDAAKLTVITSNDTAVAKGKITIATADGGASNGLIKKTVKQSTDYLIAVKASDSSKTAIYHAKSTNDATIVAGEIKLIAEVNGDLTADTSWLA